MQTTMSSADVIERVTEIPLVTYLADHVFAPAGMDHTWSGEPPDWAQLALGYYEWRDVFGLAALQTDAWNRQCCNFISTATDVARFDSALFRVSCFQTASLHAMQQAFQSTRQAGMLMIGRQGTPSGYVAGNALFVRDRFAIVALTNCARVSGPSRARSRADALLSQRGSGESAFNERGRSRSGNRRSLAPILGDCNLSRLEGFVR